MRGLKRVELPKRHCKIIHKSPTILLKDYVKSGNLPVEYRDEAYYMGIPPAPLFVTDVQGDTVEIYGHNNRLSLIVNNKEVDLAWLMPQELHEIAKAILGEIS